MNECLVTNLFLELLRTQHSPHSATRSSSPHKCLTRPSLLSLTQRRPGYHRFYNEQLFSRQIQHAVATLKQVQCRPRGRGAGPPQNPPHRPSRTLGPPSRPWPSAAPRACLYRRNATADASGSGGECQPGVLFSWHSLRVREAVVLNSYDTAASADLFSDGHVPQIYLR